ncbi:uncharacterized protein HaLaN_23119, partial [Haematococcus lacustris]
MEDVELLATLNKRLFLALLARPYPWMDIGITALVPEALWANITHPVKGSREGAAQMEKVVMGMVGRPNVTMEAWTQYDLTLSIDGFGPPWRLPRQLLGMTPIVKVESPLKLSPPAAATASPAATLAGQPSATAPGSRPAG